MRDPTPGQPGMYIQSKGDAGPNTMDPLPFRRSDSAISLKVLRSIDFTVRDSKPDTMMIRSLVTA